MTTDSALTVVTLDVTLGVNPAVSVQKLVSLIWHNR